MASSSKVWRGWRGFGTTEAVGSSSITLAPVGISAPRPRPRPVRAVIRLLLVRGRRRTGGRRNDASTPATVPAGSRRDRGPDPRWAVARRTHPLDGTMSGRTPGTPRTSPWPRRAYPSALRQRLAPASGQRRRYPLVPRQHREPAVACRGPVSPTPPTQGTDTPALPSTSGRRGLQAGRTRGPPPA